MRLARPSRRIRLPRGPSRWEETFASQCRILGLPEPKREYRFAEADGRRWRFDFAWPLYSVAVEIEGLTRFGSHLGRHQSAAGLARDAEKYNAATLRGWSVMRLVPAMVQNLEKGAYPVKDLLKAKGWRE